MTDKDAALAEGDSMSAADRRPLRELRDKMQAFKDGTVESANTPRARLEVEAIWKTLNVVIAEIDAAVAEGDAPTFNDGQHASTIHWLRGMGYHDAAKALADLHAEDMALRGIHPYPFTAVERAALPPAPAPRLEREALKRIAADAMTAQSDPDASANVYRRALQIICSDALKVLDGVAPAPDWQPIETAPKDGTNVLLWWPFWCKGRPTIGYFGFHGIQQWAAPECLEGDGDPPTHWMPLPTEPGVAEASALARTPEDK
jgi:hypothetical protein